ncbi:TonB-dependent receptor [Capnocytophaga sp. HP1101]
MKTFLLAITLAFCTLCFSQEGTIKGTITSEGRPLEAVTIQLEGKTFKKWTTSDRNGQYSLSVPAGEYRLKIRSLGYIPYNDKVTIVEDETLSQDVSLKEDVVGMEEVVVTATKTKENRRDAPVLVSVTTNRELVNVKAHTLMEGLVFQPGLRTEVNCQNCGTSQVRINGLEGAYSQILIDSRPIFGSLNGVYGLDQIPANMIERIEVIRGGGSALFGSNAIAGTINVITKNPTKNEAQASIVSHLIGGESGDVVSSFNGSLVSDNYMRGISFHAMQRTRQAYDANDDDFTEITRLRNLNAGAKLFNDFTDRHKLTAELNVSNENRRGGNKLDVPEHLADLAESIRTQMMGGNASFDYFSPAYNHKFTVYTSAERTRADNYYGSFDGTDIEASSGNYGVTKESIWLLGGQHTAYVPTDNGNLQWTSGAEYQYDKIAEKRQNPNVLAVNQKANTFGLFTQADWRISPKIKVLGGLRFDNVSSDIMKKSVTALNPRASVLYNIDENFIARGSYSRGFRAPFFYSEDVHSELQGGEARRVRLADDLKKETSDSFTASFEYNHTHDTHQFVAMLEGFYTALHNRFTYEDAGLENGLPIREKQNSDGAVVKGINIELKYSPNPKFMVQLATTIQSAKYNSVQTPEENVETDEILRTPNVYGNLMATYKPQPNWDINLVTVYTGSMKTTHLKGYIPATRLETTPAMWDIGVNTAYEFKFQNFFPLEVSCGVKNLFNQYQKDFDKGPERDANYIYGPSLPRTVFVGLKVKI